MVISDFKLEYQWEFVQNVYVFNPPIYTLHLAQCLGHGRDLENIFRFVIKILNKHNYVTPQNGDIFKYKQYN